jgi:mycofactocin precursor
MRTRPPSNVEVAGSMDRLKSLGSGVVTRSGGGRRGAGPSPFSLLGERTGQSWQEWEPRRPRARMCTTQGGQVMSEETEVRDVDVQTDDEVDELLVEEVSIDGMCGVY